MLWLGLRSLEFPCFPEGEQVKRANDKVLCLSPNGAILASFPFEEVLVYTRRDDLVEMLRRDLAEDAKAAHWQPVSNPSHPT